MTSEKLKQPHPDHQSLVMVCCCLEGGLLPGAPSGGEHGTSGAVLRRSCAFITLLFNAGVWFAFANVLAARDSLTTQIERYEPTQCTVTTAAEVQEFKRTNKTTKYRAFIKVFYRDSFGGTHRTDLYSSGGNDAEKADYSTTYPADFVARFGKAKDSTFECFFDPEKPAVLVLYLPTEGDVNKVVFFAVLVAVLGGAVGCVCIRRSCILFVKAEIERDRVQMEETSRKAALDSASGHTGVQRRLGDDGDVEMIVGEAPPRRGSRDLVGSDHLFGVDVYKHATPTQVKASHQGHGGQHRTQSHPKNATQNPVHGGGDHNSHLVTHYDSKSRPAIGSDGSGAARPSMQI